MKYERFVKKHDYTVDSGRHILKDGKSFIFITRAGDNENYVNPTEVDKLTHEVCAWLNSRDENMIG